MRLRAKCDALQSQVRGQGRGGSHGESGIDKENSGAPECHEDEHKFENVELRLKYDENAHRMQAMERTNKMLVMQIEAMRSKAPDPVQCHYDQSRSGENARGSWANSMRSSVGAGLQAGNNNSNGGGIDSLHR